MNELRDNLEGIEPLSLSQITPEIRLMASRCILADAESGTFSRDAHKYAAYTIIRENQLKSSLAANRELQKEYDELRLAARVNHDEEMQQLEDVGVPECPLHGGYCAPHVGEWMRETKERAEKAEAANREQKAEIERLMERYRSLSLAVGKPMHSSRAAEHYAEKLRDRADKAEAELASLRASVGEKPEDAWGRGWSNGYEWARAQLENRATLAIRNYVAPTLPGEEK